MKPVRDYVVVALDQIFGDINARAIAENKCPRCGGPFPCTPCHLAAMNQVDDEVRKLREHYRRKGDPRGA